MKRIFAILLVLTLLLGVISGFAESDVEPMVDEAVATSVPAEPVETEKPEATNLPEATEEPVEELTTSPVDDTTTLPDGEYVPSGCTGGSSKVSFSCPKIVVKDGKATATLVISSSKYLCRFMTGALKQMNQTRCNFPAHQSILFSFTFYNVRITE